MGKSESRAKDAAMAAGLLRTTTHSNTGVAAHKRHRLNAFMSALSPSVVGSAKFRRMRAR